MQQLQNEHRDITVLAVNFTSSEKNRKTVEAFADSLALTYPIVLDQEGINAKYGIFSYPMTFIINESGIIEDIVLGTITKKKWKKSWDYKNPGFLLILQKNGENENHLEVIQNEKDTSAHI